MKKIFDNIHGNTEIYMDVLRAICGDTGGKSMMDLCCNLAPHTPLLGFKDRSYIDVLYRTLDHPAEQRHFYQLNVLNFENRKPLDLDVTIASDAIEHFQKEDGILLRTIMEKFSRKQILFTPLGEYMVDINSTDPEGHHSGWAPEEFTGYAAIVFPDYHPTLGVGAFFVWRCDDIEKDFERVMGILNTKSWTK